MEKIIIKLNIRNEPKIMCIVTGIVSNVNLVNGGKYMWESSIRRVN